MYESRRTRPLAVHHFVGRMLRHAAAALLLVCGSLGLGMWGYHGLESRSWLDAFLDAAMLLGGMGPVHTPATDAGRLFAGLYALYAGLVFIVTAGLLLAPAVHRVLHTFHWDD